MITGVDGLPITKSDTVYLAKYGYVRNGASSGDINVLPVNRANSDTSTDGVVFHAVQPGEIIPILVKKVFSTSTTATVMELITQS